MPRARDDAPRLVCVSCKREATQACKQKIGLLRRCGALLCDDCQHYDDRRAPLHDRISTDRSKNRWRSEEQAEELAAIEELEPLTGDANKRAGPVVEKPLSRRERKKQRDDLVQLLDELKPQTVVVEPVEPE